MANKTEFGIDQEKLYDYTDVARILNISPRTFKEQYLTSEEMDCFKAGNTYWLPGYVIYNYVQENICRYQKRKSKSSPESEENSS